MYELCDSLCLLNATANLHRLVGAELQGLQAIWFTIACDVISTWREGLDMITC